jgi:hypothetical protein
MTIIVILAVTFLAGVLAGVLVIVRLAIGREEREGFFTSQAPTRATAAARSVAGLYVRGSCRDPLPGSLKHDRGSADEPR